MTRTEDAENHLMHGFRFLCTIPETPTGCFCGSMRKSPLELHMVLGLTFYILFICLFEGMQEVCVGACVSY